MIIAICLFVAAIVLPVSRLVWNFRKAKKAGAQFRRAVPAATGNGISFDQFDVLIAQLADERQRQRWASAWDVFFIGLGTAAGGIGSLIALFPTLLK